MTHKFTAIVLSGGGIKGIGQLGVLQYYYEKGMIDPEKITEYAGTSIGSVICLLMVCGYTPMEIFQEVCVIDNFAGTTTSSLDIWGLIQNYGLVSIDPFISIIEKLILKKMVRIPSLKELYNKTHKKFTVTAVNISKMRLEYFSHETRPNISALEAVKISCSLPLIFYKIKYGEDYYTDGGLANNFPIEVITPSLLTLGIIVTGIDYTSPAKDSFFNYVSRLILLPINMITKLRSKNVGDNVKIVNINFDNIPLIDFIMSGTQKMNMFKKGYNLAKQNDGITHIYIDGWDQPEGWDVEFTI